MQKPKSQVYDLPLRLFHWAFALLFIVSFTITKVVDDESIIFTYHKLSGIMMIFLIILRLFWGFVGSKYSKFNSFQLKPSELLKYSISIVNSKTKRYLGHNPASSFAGVGMFFFAIGLGVSGMLMTQRINKHFFEDVHELFANGFLVLVLLHISGVMFHQLKHKDGMIFSMFTGKKESLEGEDEIKSSRPMIAILFVFLILIFGVYLKSNFDTTSGKLNLFGKSLQLGEVDKGEKGMEK